MLGDVVIENLTMSTTWTSLELHWSLPSSYAACKPTYAVQVCNSENCWPTVMTSTLTYVLTDLTPCTEYTASVSVQVSPGIFNNKANVTNCTTDKGNRLLLLPLI